MSRRSWGWGPLLAALSLVFGLITAAPAQAANVYGWAWPSSTITVQDNTNGGWPIAEALARWNKGTSLNLVLVPSDGDIVISETTAIGGPWGGLTDWDFVNGVPVKSYITMNELWDSTHTRYSAVTMGLLLHEIGHGFGLAHASTTKAVMYFRSPTNVLSFITTPTADDRRGVRILY